MNPAAASLPEVDAINAIRAQHKLEPVDQPRLKAFEFAPDSLKFADEGEGGTFEGIASAVGVLDRHHEIIEPGAFDSVGSGVTKPLLWQHRSDQPIGVIHLSVDKRGNLAAKGDINLETQLGREAYALLKQGAIQAMSIGFNIPEGGAQFDSATGIVHINAVEVWETSLVTFPANPAATVDSVKETALLLEFAKAGRVLSKSNRNTLIAAKEAIEAVLEADQPTDTDAKSVDDDAIGTPHGPLELDGVKQLIAEMSAGLKRRATQDV